MLNEDTRVCFIINLLAGRNRAVQHLKWLEEEAQALWKYYEITIAKEDESLSDLAQTKSQDFDVIVACGGDGTISQIINGLANTDTTLGCLPIGSGNDFVKSIGLDISLSECLKIIHRKHTKSIDLIRYTGDVEGWCVNTMGIGLDGVANYYAGQASYLGPLRYYYGALQAILRFRGCKMKIQSDKEMRKREFLMATVCNGKWEGGNFLVAPEANMHDGMLELLTIEKVPLLLLMIYLFQFRRGPSNWMKGTETHVANKAEVTTDKPVAIHRDGEHLGANIQHLKFEVKRNALKILVKKDY